VIFHFRFRLSIAFLLLLWPALVLAQSEVTTATAFDPARARIHLGPLALDPRLAIRNIGVDTNVFNDADTPVRDFTATFGPALDSAIRIGRLSWLGTSSLAWNYYRDSENQRSFDAGQSGRLELALGHLVPYAVGSLERTRQRPNVEIDARVRRRTAAVGAGVEVLLGAKTTIGLEYAEREFDFGDAGLEGTDLARTLDRREATTRLLGRYALTPLTTLVMQAAVREDRFRLSPDRNTDSQLLLPGVEFKPLALIAGRAAVGVRRFQPRSGNLPGFTGVVSDVELSYLMRDLTRWTVGVARDVDYSFQELQPYYVSTGTTLSVVQALGAGWDVVGRFQHTMLDYRALVGVTDGTDRRDRVTVYGGGAGRRFGTTVRIGIDVDQARRTSNAVARSYDGLRVGGSFTYGF
jgi:hypothetical protein